MTFKKLFLAVFSAFLLISLAGCVGQKDLASTLSQQAYNYVWIDENNGKEEGALYFGVIENNQGYYRKYSNSLDSTKATFDSDVKKEKHTYSISKDGASISLSDDGQGNNSGIGTNVAALELKKVKMNNGVISAEVWYHSRDHRGEITLTPVKD